MRNEADRLEVQVNELMKKQMDQQDQEKSERGSEMESDEDVSYLFHFLIFLLLG